jgi:N6-L-threonylcarbamoyladenine synthase
MKILGIESTCDETSVAIVEDGRKILSLVVSSSTDIHQKYGGVFPELASRRHIEAIVPLLEETMGKANTAPEDIDAIAVARGPGLIGSLLIGVNAAKGLSIAWNKPLIGVNHVEAHLYAAMMDNEELFPALGLVLSGGHTLLLKIHDIGSYERIGTTVDDALGEAFDKVAALLGLPYPGGPHVEKLATSGNPSRFPFSAGRVKKNPYDFSFSGLKTNVLYTLRELDMTETDKADAAASFQETALQDIADKTALALPTFSCKAIYLGGGVCNNKRLKAIFESRFQLPIFWPSFDLSLDNAAMIAGLGYHKFLVNPSGDPLDLEVQTRIPIA